MKMLLNLIFMALLTAFTSYNCHAQSLIEIFTEEPAQVDAAPLDVKTVHYNTNETERLKESSLPKLPPNQDQAMKILAAFFSSPAGEEFKQNYRIAVQGKKKAIEYQLQKLPAIVFDGGKFVIYGSTDIHMARQLYIAHLSDHEMEP